MGLKHPFADQFPNRQAWRFERELAALARTARSAEGLQQWINLWPATVARRRDPQWRHRPLTGGRPGGDLATAWRAFVNRKLAALPWPAQPEQVQAITTGRTRQLMRTLRRAGPPGRDATATAAAPPPAVVFRRDTGERVEVIEASPYLRRAGPAVETTRLVARAPRGGPEVYMTERQRAPGGPVPAGWVTEHIGRWHGRDTEVVYNPRRHQVMVTAGNTDIFDALDAQGWQRHGTDGDRAVWTRDRLDATRAALTRLDHAAVFEPPAPELRPAIGLKR